METPEVLVVEEFDFGTPRVGGVSETRLSTIRCWHLSTVFSECSCFALYIFHGKGDVVGDRTVAAQYLATATSKFHQIGSEPYCVERATFRDLAAEVFGIPDCGSLGV